MMIRTVAVLGAGSWGLTLAVLARENNAAVTLWEFDPTQAARLAAERTLSFFPYLILPGDITVTHDLATACKGADLILIAVPSHAMQATTRSLAQLPLNWSARIIVSATKGIDPERLMCMSEIIGAELPATAAHLCVLSGPSHAEEVAQHMPTSITAASRDASSAAACQELFSSSCLRVYTHDDLAGVETGGALKNIFAIAAGISDGLSYGDNTKAAIVTRGMREIVSLGTLLGGRRTTYFGLTGLGDLVVTCFSRHSRNRALGERIGRGQALADAERGLLMIAEGVRTTRSARELGRRHGLELPIVESVYDILFEGRPPLDAVRTLMNRQSKPEMLFDEELAGR